MYTPLVFEMKQTDEICEMVRATSVGLLVSLENGEPLANLLPFEVIADGENMRLTAHLAKANGQWKNLQGQDVLVVF